MTEVDTDRDFAYYLLKTGVCVQSIKTFLTVVNVREAENKPGFLNWVDTRLPADPKLAFGSGGLPWSLYPEYWRDEVDK